jgi:hypothetical protein
MPRLRQPRKLAEIDDTESVSKLFDSSMIKPKEEEAPHENVEAKEQATGPVEVSIEPKVEVAEPEKKEDPALALQKQLEELKKSEEVSRNLAIQAKQREDQKDRELQEVNRRAAEADKKVIQADYQTITTGLEAAKERLESAKRDLRTAETSGDIEAKIEAQDRLADAKYDFRTYQNAKIEIDERFEAEKAAPKVEPKQEAKQPTVEQAIDSWNLPEITTKYLKAHPGYVTDTVRFNELRYWNDRAVKAGLQVHTQPYIDYVEEKMNPPAEEKVEPKQEQQRTNIVSAPVSREVPSSSGTRPSGKITLSKEEQEAAKISGITETEYARQKSALLLAKQNGQYTGGQ